jgi:hypothetical protein
MLTAHETDGRGSSGWRFSPKRAMPRIFKRAAGWRLEMARRAQRVSRKRKPFPALHAADEREQEHVLEDTMKLPAEDGR